MRNSSIENLSEHSHMTAVLAHALAVIRRDIFGEACDPERAAALAVFHDAPEILTGDMPTPIKYANDALTSAYKEMERLAAQRLLALLPDELRASYEKLLLPEEDTELSQIVHAADKLAALIKCVEERKAGNSEFVSAERETLRKLREMGLREADYFLDRFMPAFELDLDGLGVDDFSRTRGE